MDEPELTETELATMREGLRLAARHMRIKGAAKVAAARQRYRERKAEREEYLSAIALIAPEATPFMSLIRPAAVEVKFPDWQTDVEDKG